MAGERVARILERLASGGDTVPGTRRLCELSAELTGTDGAGIMLMSDGVARGAVCVTDEVSGALEDLQFSLGEGPCMDAYRLDRPVVEVDLADAAVSRWVAFAPQAVAAGAGAVFCFPLQLGTVRLGALDLYRDRPGPLSDEQHADALAVARVTTRVLLMMQAQAPPGEMAAELEAGVNFRIVVHQASGMVSAQLGVSVADALARLRAHAFGTGRLVDEVAAEVVSRRLRFDDGELGP